MDKTWTVKTDGGPIKYVSVSGQEFDLSRVGGRWRLRDYLNRLEAEAKLAREMCSNWPTSQDVADFANWALDFKARYDAAHGTQEQEVTP